MGHSVTDQKIFRDFAAYWEKMYFKDMDDLNIQRPNVLTRVSEYVPEIVAFVEKIIQNGYAYEIDGSVYFDTIKFDNTDGHDYAKLEPWSAGNVKLIQEGEGDLSKDPTGKKNSADFALWKKSKQGEPAWDSPWGQGRPGWHIECSVMASDVLGKRLDIHSGGIDLAFPHHDNEIAQCEGYFNCKQWVNYFLHAGHLHIEGQKMSKSLKNFVTIQEALESYTAAQIRLFFLLHPWDSVLDYSTNSMNEAKAFESFVNNYMSMVKAVAREQSASYVFTGNHNFHEAEKELLKVFKEKQILMNEALCDSFNTPVVMQEIRSLISTCNTYYQDKNKSKATPNADLLSGIAEHITRLFLIFGVYPNFNPLIGSNSLVKENSEEIILPFVTALSTFRDSVREMAQKKADPIELLKLCDKLRDVDLIELGISLEDRDDGKALVKMMDKSILLQQKQEKLTKEFEKNREKEEKKRLQQLLLKSRLERSAIKPSEMFQNAEYSSWDANGLPLTDSNGVELSKSKRKKLEKEYNAQVKLHEEYLKSQS